MPHIKIIVMAAIGRLAARRAYSKVGEKWVMHFTKTAVAATTTSPLSEQFDAASGQRRTSREYSRVRQ